jgi:hypothetical protein
MSRGYAVVLLLRGFAFMVAFPLAWPPIYRFRSDALLRDRNRVDNFSLCISAPRC